MGEFRSAAFSTSGASPFRYLTTVEVQTCMALFAWARKSEDETIGFGAHVPKCAVFPCWGPGFKGISNPGAEPLRELSDALREAFAGVAPAAVRVRVCGGYGRMDAAGPALPGRPALHEPGERRRFSWHVAHAARAAGLSDVDTSMVNLFEGSAAGQRVPNANFIVAALDLETGRLLAHTEDASARVPESWAERWLAASAACWRERGGSRLAAAAA